MHMSYAYLGDSIEGVVNLLIGIYTEGAKKT